MEPHLNAAARTPRRQSCDRCHGQKLRCTRLDNRKTGSCERCLRSGTPCVYSSSLPKGRPSLYRLSEVTPTSRIPSHGANSSVPSNSPDSTSDVPGLSPESPTRPVTAVGPDRQCGRDLQVDSHINTDIQDVDLNLSNSSDVFSDFWAPSWQDGEMGDNMVGIVASSSTYNLDPALKAQSLANFEFPGHIPAESDELSSGGAGEDGPNMGDAGDDAAMDSNSASNYSCSSSRVMFVADQSNFELNMVRLSRLSTRLSQLLGSSRDFLSRTGDTPRPFESNESVSQIKNGVESLFKSINTWLVYGSVVPNSVSPNQADLGPTNPFDLLHHIFSATNQMLEILQSVRVSVESADSSSRPSTSAGPCPSAPDARGHAETGALAATSSSRPPGDSSHHHSYSVVHHLVIACVTLLMNMYVTILVALQRSAHALNPHQAHAADASSGSGPRAQLAEPDNRTMDPTERVHLQLVVVVQMCSYFIRRQNQTLDVLVSSSLGPEAYEPSGPLNAVGELKTEVEQRLRRLEESLHIFV
ncbi:hypothetical protein GGR52DRAFT_545984 [Hypoxylon sp. FL1284]|nr:hypothetical protein GGR52DRAFT_545984 [Hypoxylon sp. FL1284]